MEEERHKLSHVTASRVWGGREKAVACYSVLGLGARAKAVTCYGVWGLGDESKSLCMCIHAHVRVFVSVCVCVFVCVQASKIMMTFYILHFDGFHGLRDRVGVLRSITWYVLLRFVLAFKNRNIMVETILFCT